MEDAKPIIDQTVIAGFWRRVFAFILDGLLLGLIGAGLGAVLFDFCVSLGEAGRIVGFFIALIYLGVMNSQVFGGQTLGKWLMKIRVVSKRGTMLSLMTSFLRSSIICIPLSVNGMYLDTQFTGSWFEIVLGVVLSVLVFGITLSLIYLFIFNRKTRQSLHDLLVGSYVVKAQSEITSIDAGKLWRGHVAIVGGILLLAVAAPILGLRVASGSPLLSSLISLQRAVGSDPDIRRVSVLEDTNSFHDMDSAKVKVTTSISVSAIVKSKNVDKAEIASRIAHIVLTQYADADKKDYISITLVTGYDIGIASSWRSQQFSYSPSQWRQQLLVVGRSQPKLSSIGVGL